MSKKTVELLQGIGCILAGSAITWFMLKELGLLSIQEVTIRQTIAFYLVWAFVVFGCFGLKQGIKLWLKNGDKNETI